MRAVVLRQFGPPGRLTPTDVPDPVAGAGQVIVTVEFAGITFVETQLRSGHPPHPSMAPALPVILGNGVGGTVTSVGPGVDPALLGRECVTTTGGRGGYAEQVAVDAAGLIARPAAVSMASAVALLADGRTAIGLIAAAGVRAGQTVLVEAAAGGVGSLLVQLAAGAGATVAGLAGGAGKLSLATELGARHVADYTRPRWAEEVREAVGAVDIVFDGVGGSVGRQAFELVRPGGRMCTHGMASGEFAWISDEVAAARGVALVRGVAVSPEQMRELTASALTAAANGVVRPVIGQMFPLDDAAVAHAAIESRQTIGKILLTVS